MKATIDGVTVEGSVEEIYKFVKLHECETVPTVTNNGRTRSGIQIKVTDSTGNNKVYRSIAQWCQLSGMSYKNATQKIKEGPFRYEQWLVEPYNNVNNVS